MKQGEVWLINLDPTVGSEIKKTRPGIIVNDNTLGKLPLKVIVPLTDWKDVIQSLMDGQNFTRQKQQTYQRFCC